MQFDMNRAWNEAVAMIRANRELLLIVAGIFFFLPSLLSSFVMPVMPGGMSFDPKDITALEAQMSALYANYWWLFLIVLGGQLIGYLALLSLLGDSNKPTVGGAIMGGFTALLPALLTYVLFVFGLSLILVSLLSIGFISNSSVILVVLGGAATAAMIYLAVKFSLSAPVIAIERVYNPVKVLTRSWELTTNNSVRLFVFFMLIVLVYFVVSMVLGMVTVTLVALSSSFGELLRAIVSGLIGASMAVVFVAVLTAVHRQLAGPRPGTYGSMFE